MRITSFADAEKMFGYEKAKQIWNSRGKKKANKYGNRKTDVDDIKFDSKAEADYYASLLLMKRAGEIKDFTLQPEFTLQEAFTSKGGRKVSKMKYVADFLVYYPNGNVEVVDVKGFENQLYINKRKMLLKQNTDISFVEIIKGKRKEW